MAVMGVEFVIVIISYIALGGRWFVNDVPNARALSEGKFSKKRSVISTSISRFTRCHKFHMRDLVEDFIIT